MKYDVQNKLDRIAINCMKSLLLIPVNLIGQAIKSIIS